jgi:MoaA/NifB/PqqE/SkfB family radical SAM enzyme
MRYKNPSSNRENAFRIVYDSSRFKYVLERPDSPATFPFIVDMELTNKCNLACIFCGRQAMKRKTGFMQRSVFNKVIDECALYGTPVRFIRWGEPFLHPDVIEYANYVKSKGLLLHITNNGLAISAHQMRSLVDIGVDSLTFSLQGATKHMYEIMRGNERYNELEVKIAEMVRIRADMDKPFLHISSTMTNESAQEIEAFVKYWGGLVDAVDIGKTDLSIVSVLPEKYQMAGIDAEELKKQETIVKRYKPCTEVYQKLSVDWDGKVTCCCRDYNNFFELGDVSKTSLFEIWNGSERLHSIRSVLVGNGHRNFELCKGCYHTYDEFS